MKNKVVNVKASIKARLKNKAREAKKPFQEILQYYSMERFLYRFSKSEYSNKFVLKGALMFTVWEVIERRPTIDIDFSGNFDNEIEAIEKVVKDIFSIHIKEDGIVFDPKTVKGDKIKENADYEGVRVRFIGFIEKTKIPMQLDVAFGDVIYPKPKKISYPTILDNIPRPQLQGYPVESVISEKFETMIKLGSLNSRMKDFYDIWLLMRNFNFNGEKLKKAVKNTFEYRKTSLPKSKPLFDEEIYDKESDRQVLWKAFLNKNDIKNTPRKLQDVAEQIETFLIQPVNSILKSERFEQKWISPGPWK